jgi:hypothetical protein
LCKCVTAQQNGTNAQNTPLSAELSIVLTVTALTSQVNKRIVLRELFKYSVPTSYKNELVNFSELNVS